MIQSSRSSRARVAEWRIRSICSLIELSFSMKVSVARHIGFRLVIIVIGHEIFDGVVREEALELAVKLRRQSLWLGARIKAGRWVRAITCAIVKVSGAGDAEQNLIALLRLQAFDQRLDGARLVALRLIIRRPART